MSLSELFDIRSTWLAVDSSLLIRQSCQVHAANARTGSSCEHTPSKTPFKCLLEWTYNLKTTFQKIAAHVNGSQLIIMSSETEKNGRRGEKHR